MLCGASRTPHSFPPPVYLCRTPRATNGYYVSLVRGIVFISSLSAKFFGPSVRPEPTPANIITSSFHHGTPRRFLDTLLCCMLLDSFMPSQVLRGNTSIQELTQSCNIDFSGLCPFARIDFVQCRGRDVKPEDCLFKFDHRLAIMDQRGPDRALGAAWRADVFDGTAFRRYSVGQLAVQMRWVSF